MIFTVAIISPATTGLKAGSVAKVMASSIWLRRSIAALSTTSTPAVSANRLARPVKARSTRTPSPATAAAISAALIFRHVARLEPRHDDLGNAGGLQRGDLGLAPISGALLEHELACGGSNAPAIAALGLVTAATGPNFMPPPARLRLRASWRSRARDLAP